MCLDVIIHDVLGILRSLPCEAQHTICCHDHLNQQLSASLVMCIIQALPVSFRSLAVIDFPVGYTNVGSLQMKWHALYRHQSVQR